MSKQILDSHRQLDDPVGEIGVHEASSQVRFSAMKFAERYQPASICRREA